MLREVQGKQKAPAANQPEELHDHLQRGPSAVQKAALRSVAVACAGAHQPGKCQKHRQPDQQLGDQTLVAQLQQSDK